MFYIRIASLLVLPTQTLQIEIGKANQFFLLPASYFEVAGRHYDSVWHIYPGKFSADLLSCGQLLLAACKSVLRFVPCMWTWFIRGIVSPNGMILGHVDPGLGWPDPNYPNSGHGTCRSWRSSHSDVQIQSSAVGLVVNSMECIGLPWLRWVSDWKTTEDFNFPLDLARHFGVRKWSDISENLPEDMTDILGLRINDINHHTWS